MTPRTLSLAAPVLMLLAMAYQTFVYALAFNYTLAQDRHVELLAFAFLALILYVLISLPAIRQQSVRIIFCSLVLMGCCLDYGNEYGNTIAILLVLTILITGTPASLLLPCFFYGNLCFLLIQTGIAFDQYWQNDPMSGSFGNTGVLANYLATAMPSLYILRGPMHLPAKNILRFLGLLQFSAILFIVIANRSRTALISLALSVAIVVFYDARNRYRNSDHRIPVSFKILYSLAIALGTLAIGIYSISIKQRSAAGRILLNRIALRHIGDHFWLGTGIGRFTWYYPQWQSDYFLHYPGDPLWLSAGESYLLFNEYLQLFETIGFVGMILFLGVLGWFFTTRQVERSAALFMIKLTVLAILVSGTAFYPFHVNVIIFSFFLCIGLAFSLDERKTYRTVMRRLGMHLQKRGPWLTAMLVAGLLGSMICLPGVLRRKYALAAWRNSRDVNRAYAVEKSDYERLYPVLRRDGKFLGNFGIFLLQDTAETLRAVQILGAANERFISRETMMALGNAYRMQKDRRKAIQCFDWVKNYIPYSLEPKFDLMQLYVGSGDTARARLMANSILDTPPKIPSDKANYIIRETWRLKLTHFSMRAQD